MSTAIRGLPPGIEPADVYRFGIEQYERIIARNVFGENAPIELLDGLLFRKTAGGPPRSGCRGRCLKALAAVIPGGHSVRDGKPFRLPPSSMPEPDVTVVRGEERDFATRSPEATEVVLIVEVADSGLDFDRGLKRDLYAAAGIPNYWIVNLVDRRVEVFADPKDGAYATTTVAAEGGSVELKVDGAVWGRIEVAAVLP